MDVVSFIRPHLIKNNLEIEFRLGKKNGSFFDTNVGKDNFDKIFRRLMKYPSWESVKTQKAMVYHGARKGLRIVYDEDTEEHTTISKYNVTNLDKVLDNDPLDVRISVSIENPATYDAEKDRFPVIRKRLRTSFVRKGLSIDMTIVQNDDKDDENELKYQIELEIIKPEESLTDVAILNHYQKVFDVMKLLLV